MILLYIWFQQHQWIIPRQLFGQIYIFCREEIALDGDWRVALSEIIFRQIKQ